MVEIGKDRTEGSECHESGKYAVRGRALLQGGGRTAGDREAAQGEADGTDGGREDLPAQPRAVRKRRLLGPHLGNHRPAARGG